METWRGGRDDLGGRRRCVVRCACTSAFTSPIAQAHLDDDDPALALIANFPDIGAARIKHGLARRGHRPRPRVRLRDGSHRTGRRSPGSAGRGCRSPLTGPRRSYCLPFGRLSSERTRRGVLPCTSTGAVLRPLPASSGSSWH
ncbi:hypothetical protein ADK51_12570 [Streptomyces sp. WM6368]|nr:hypothetical protein ADK51_12570 [Streptomyces sp. WM6368]